MNSVGKYNIELSPIRNLRVYKPDLSATPIGALTIKAQRKGETKPEPLAVENIIKTGEELAFTINASNLGIKITGRFNYFSDFDGLECEMSIEAQTRTPEFNLLIQWEVPDAGVPRWLIPGVFYKDNRLGGNLGLYPGFSLTAQAPEKYNSSYWAFAAERTATPCVFAWTDRYSLYLGTSARFDDNETGVSLEGGEGKTILGVNFPWREEPVRYCDFPPQTKRPAYGWLQLKAEEVKKIWFQLGAAKRDLHYYDSILRYRYFKEKEKHPLNPWISREEVKQLAGYGLMQWHYDPQQKIIAETCVFDRHYACKSGYVECDDMHVAWLSGVPTAYALLWLGHNMSNTEYIKAAQLVIDNIADNLTPAGTFWGRWSASKGWTASSLPEDNLLHARTLAEATLFMIRALRLDLRRGKSHPNWAQAIVKNLKFCLQVQRSDGNFGSYYDATTGKVVSWEGTAGLLWIAALIAGAMLFQADEFVAAALRGANYYARFVEDECLYGAPEDIGMAPSSEDGYCAIIAYQLLYQFNRYERWLELARRAADWTLTFRLSYNVKFSPHTILGTYDFRTRGADIASVMKAALHCYGLICYPELYRLAYFFKDEYYRERAQDNLLCFRQFIAREDGDFGARKGMMSAQFYHADWRQPKGHLLTVSLACCLGLTLLANLCEEQSGLLP